jgi:hypothetical protein
MPVSSHCTRCRDNHDAFATTSKPATVGREQRTANAALGQCAT